MKSKWQTAGALAARVAEMAEKARHRAEREGRERLPGTLLSSNVVQLPLWPAAVRGAPNGCLRSALFGVFAKGRRRYMRSEQVATLGGTTILYTGERLDQGDLDTWLSIVHAVRLQALGEQCHITSYALLKLMGKTDTGKNRKMLHARITRLRASALEIKHGQYTYIGGLIEEAYKDDESQKWVIVISTKLSALFAADQFTQIDWGVRRSLDGKPLAQWLHGFYASHAKPYPMRPDTLLKLAGSEDANLSSALQTLRRALDALSEASQTHDQPFSYEIQGHLVHVKKKPSRSQRRHLDKKHGKQRNTRCS